MTIHLVLSLLLLLLIVAARTSDATTVFRNNGHFQSALEIFLDDPATGTELYGPIADWDIRNVTSLSGAFADTVNFDQDVSRWNTSAVTTMAHLCRGSHQFAANMATWDTSRVQYWTSAFAETVNMTAGDLTGWNVQQAVSANGLFAHSESFAGNLSGWQWSSVAGMAMWMQGTQHFQADLSNWNVSTVQTMHGMFQESSQFRGNLQGWNPQQVTSLQSLFRNAANFHDQGALNRWDVSKVNDMAHLLDTSVNCTIHVTNWNTSSLQDLGYAFTDAQGLSIDVARWDTSQVTNMLHLLHKANGDVPASQMDNWNVSSVTSFNGFLSLAKNVIINVTSWDTAKVESLSGLLAATTNVSLVGMDHWNVASVTSMDRMFQVAENPGAADLSNWDTRNLRNLNSAFFQAVGVAEILNSMQNWNVSGLEEMAFAFYDVQASWVYIPETGYLGHDYRVPVRLCWSLNNIREESLHQVSCQSSLVQWDCPCVVPQHLQAMNVDCSYPMPVCTCPPDSPNCWLEVPENNPNDNNDNNLQLLVGENAITTPVLPNDCEEGSSCVQVSKKSLGTTIHDDNHGV